MRAEVNNTEIKKEIQRSNAIRHWFFKTINKINCQTNDKKCLNKLDQG